MRDIFCGKHCGGKRWGTICFYCLLVFAAIFLVAQAVSPSVKTLALNQFHLKQKSFKIFAAIHFIPPMYSFANEVWYTHDLVDFDEIEQNSSPQSEIIHIWLNHYPLRFVTNSIIHRGRFFFQEKPQYVYVRSKFTNITARTVYELQRDPQGLVMKRIELAERNEEVEE